MNVKETWEGREKPEVTDDRKPHFPHGSESAKRTQRHPSHRKWGFRDHFSEEVSFELIPKGR